MADRNLDIKHSEYIVYVDESGDHSLITIDPDYPVFVLSFCIFKKLDYAFRIAPAVRLLKFSTFGHDMVILHESDIRRRKGAFSHLLKPARDKFLNKLTGIMSESEFHLIATVIDKRKLNPSQRQQDNPYHIALRLGLQNLNRLLDHLGQTQSLTYVVCESRGKREDSELGLEFRRIRDDDFAYNRDIQFDLVMADKRTNSEGLQIADLTARPLGLKVLRPNQANRAMDTIESKMARIVGHVDKSIGLTVFP
jgi:hypothetical protein